MTALTPGCDPDMSTTGAPFGSVPARPRLVSGAVLLGFVVLAALLVRAGAPGVLAVPVLVVAVPCAVALVARAVRLAQHAGGAAAAPVARALHLSRPVPGTTS
ncbi:hypothetical protein [Blastococcus litoris]|uniref:hypothetical protein n=1 Tax=Blastococcus litoris TaxID=2171622 RepID=UPI000E3059ED|nr:hypothetical protein [Blastococcus litoris]